ncbi:MAG: ISKra4 family transposase [Anaerolineae bacterium]|nr:ISKra4 family transposase [Anaerolineae bacterium]
MRSPSLAVTLFAPTVTRGFSPLDEELGLLPGHLTPTLQQHTTRLSAWIPFPKAGVILKDILDVEISPATARRCTEHHGKMYEEVETAAVTAIETQLPDPPQGPKKQLLSVDGAYVPLVHGQWVEVKTVAIGGIEEPVLEQDEWVVHSRELSYFSRWAEADIFARLALVETHRRGVETAERVIAPADGAVWIQGFLDYHRPDAERILDFGHAAEYVTRIGRVVGEPDSETFQAWLSHNRHMLKHEGGTAVLPELRAQVAAHPEQPELAEALAYLENRVTMMDYPEYQRQGWPIGSGSVESANKVVVEARLKGAGMHWAPDNVNPMLSLRGAVCSDR